ncbi:MAG: hypothetical protein M3N39_04835 [Pseudomonadota bacterium]|nr:hypothetical protein [Pseudomonadota bacterium]
MQVIERAGGTALIAAAAGTVLGMAHHPTHLSSGFVSQMAHGVLLTFSALTTFGFMTFAAARGPRPAILAGIICYAFALFGQVGAGMINGFVVPALAEHRAIVERDMFLLAWEINQAYAGLGVVAAGLAILLWSLDLLGRRSHESRAIGALGVAAGGGPAALLLSGAIEMNVTGAFLAYSAHAAWGAAVGIHLLRGKAGSTA